MTTIKSFAATGLADGALTTGTAGTGDDAFTAVGTGQVIAGGKISIPNTTDIGFGKWTGISLDAFGFRHFFTCPPAGSAATPTIYLTKTGGTRIGSITLSSARQLQLRDGAANGAQSTSAVMVVGAEYRIELYRAAGSASATWAIYNPDGSVFLAPVAKAIMGTTDLLAGLQVGRQSATQYGGVALFDNLLLADVAAEVGPLVPSTPYRWLNASGIEEPVILNGVVSSGSIIPAALSVVEIIPPSGEFRIASEWPFASNAMSNTSLKDGVLLEAPTDLKSTTLRTGLSATGALVASQVNSVTYTYPIYPDATTPVTLADPLTTVTNVKTGKVYSGTERPRIPLTAVPSGGLDAPMIVVQPDGYTSWEFYKVKRVLSSTGAPTAAITTEYVNIIDLRGDGLQAGSRASGIAAIIGEIRAKELAALRIPHVLVMGICATQMKATPSAADGDRMYNSAGKAIAVWPARLQDNQVSTNIYTGGEDVGTTPGAGIPMGSLFAIPHDVSAASTGITSAEGAALLKALQNYGAAVLLQADFVTVYVAPDANQTAATRLKADWKKLRPLLVRVKNNTRMTIGGVGTPYQPAPPDLLVNQP